MLLPQYYDPEYGNIWLRDRIFYDLPRDTRILWLASGGAVC